jgi:hypothetical protein
MAGIPKPVVDPRFGPAWTPMLQAAQAAKQQTMALNSGAPQGNLLDQWGNTIQVQGSNLAQTVTIGASHGVGGVLVSTGIPTGTSGLVVQSGPAITTITLTAGSTAATVGTVTGAGLAVGQVIGAADVSDPSSGTPTPAIQPGTTIAAVSGTSVTLSQDAVEAGTSLYCAAARFVLQQDTGWVTLTGLPSGWTTSAGGYTGSARLQGDTVRFKGVLHNASGSAWVSGAVAVLPAAMKPAALVTLLTHDGGTTILSTAVDTSGNLFANGIANGDSVVLDGVSYSIA